MGRPRYLLRLQLVFRGFETCVVNTTAQGCRIYGSRVQNGTPENFLGTQLSMLSQLTYFFCPTSVSIFWRMCVCVYIYIHTHTHTHTHMSVCVQIVNYRCYQITLRVTQFYTNRECWLGEYVTLNKTFYNRLFKQEVAATAVTSRFSPLSHYSRKPLLKT